MQIAEEFNVAVLVTNQVLLLTPVLYNSHQPFPFYGDQYQVICEIGQCARFWGVMVGQVLSDPSGGAMFVSDPKKPVGGHVMAHASTVRLSVRKGKAEQRICKVVDSPNLGSPPILASLWPYSRLDGAKPTNSN